MTINRDKKRDREGTRKLVLNPNRPKYTGGENWLGHGVRGGKDAYVDEMLLDGATMKELLKQRGAIHEHFRHLRIEHGLMYEKVGDKYRFNRADLGLTGQEHKDESRETGISDKPTESFGDLSSQGHSEGTRGAGFGDSKTNRQVEQSAISFVTNWYRAQGWTVHSVEAEKCGFELRCVRNAEEEHVEVKGIQGELQSFLNTTSEVRQARHDPRFILCAVTSALSEQPTIYRYVAKEFLDNFDLEPLTFRASLLPERANKGRV